MTALKRFGFRAALFATAILIVMVSYVSLFFVVPSTVFKQWLASEAGRRVGQTVNFSALRLTFPFTLVASGVEISNGPDSLLHAERLAVSLGFGALFSQSIHRIELHKPIFFVDLQNLFATSTEPSIGVAIRHLKVEDGMVVLKSKGIPTLEFRAVNLNAENFNMGQAGRITLQTDMPWLNGSAEVLIRSEKKGQRAQIKVRQGRVKDPPPLLSSRSPLRDAVDVKIDLHETHDRGLTIAASGRVDGWMIGTERINGHFETSADIDPGFKNSKVRAKIEAINVPAQIGSITLPAISEGTVVTLEAGYSLPEKTITFNTFHLAFASGTADVQGTMILDPEPTLVQTQATVRQVPIESIKPFLPEGLREWTARGDADADLQIEGPWRAVRLKGVARTISAELQNKMFSLQQLSVTAPFSWAESILRADDVRFQGGTLALTASDLKLAARELQLDGRLEFKPDELWKANAKLRIRGGRYATADGNKMGENFALAGDLEATRKNNQLLSLSGKVNVEQGELLWGKFFGDVKAHKPTLGFEGDYLAEQDQIRLRQLDFALTHVGSVQLSGTVQQISVKPVARIQVQGKAIQTFGVFDFFIRETLSASYPILNQLTLAGQVDLAAQVYGALDDLSVEGDLRMQRASMGVKSDAWRVGPVNLTLPFGLRTAGATQGTLATRAPTGTLAMESLRFGGESIAGVRTPVSLWNNALRFDQPIRFSIYGGTIEIRDLTWPDLIRNPRAFSLSIEAKDLQLQPLTQALGWPAFAGTLSGSIPKAAMIDDVLRNEGQIRIGVFGGQVQLSNTEIENPFSSLPAVKLDARFQDIDLERASETFAFGRISGILEGSISDLVITNGQPSQMRADVHTVARSGISQWISVEALDKITILSSGEDGSAVYGGIAGFIDEFRYSKMGFKATLRNDKLTLRGVESNDGKEYLVVGTLLPPTVNVISHTREIGFSDLLKRLKQIQKSDKPQIK